MKNKNLKYIKDIDMGKVDFDSFNESLLANVLQVKKNCRRIDTQINCLASVSFIPWFVTMSHYEAIIEKMLIKKEILDIRDIFIHWYRKLSNKEKQLFTAYFVKKDAKLCTKVTNRSDYYRTKLLPLAKSFILSVKAISNYDEEELIKNPFIYNSYVSTLRKNECYKKRGFNFKKEKHRYDS